MINKTTCFNLFFILLRIFISKLFTPVPIKASSYEAIFLKKFLKDKFLFFF